MIRIARVLRAFWLVIVVGGLVPVSRAADAAGADSLLSWGQPVKPRQGWMAKEESVAIAAGGYHNLALTREGTILAWGENFNGQCNVPPEKGLVAIVAGLYHNLALRSDGSILAWGDNTRQQCDVPSGKGFTAIAAGDWHSVAVRSDGSLVAWGWNEYGQCDVPAGNSFATVAAGCYHSLALTLDQSLLAWGGNGDGQCDVPEGARYAAVAAGSLHSLALRPDGSLATWGRNDFQQCNVPIGEQFVAIAAGAFHSLALRSDGTVFAWGLNEYAQCEVPSDATVLAVTAGGHHSVALGTEQTDLVLPGPVDFAVIEAMDANAAGTDEGRAALAADVEPDKPVDVNAVEPSETEADVLAPPVVEASEPADVNTPELVTADVVKETDANTPKPEPKRQDPAPVVEAEPEVKAAEPATALYGSIESYGCINQKDPLAKPIYHFTSETSTPHFYTISTLERDRMIDEEPDVWTYEGVAFRAYDEWEQPEGAVPVYRFWSELLSTHFYTMDDNEKETFIKDYPDLCTYQGIAWYTDKRAPSGSKQVDPNQGN